MSEHSDEAPKIQIDSDWKAQAQAEKEKLRAQEEKSRQTEGQSAGSTAAGAAGSGKGEFPPANWDSLLGTLAGQAMMYLGAYADPRTGRPIIELDAARHYIDLLGVLEEKTKSNLDEAQAKDLATVIYELRMRYVQVAQAAASGGLSGGAGAGAAEGGAMPGGTIPGGISGSGASNLGI